MVLMERVEVITLKNFINGQFVAGEAFLDSLAPATGRIHARVPETTKQQLEDAVTAANDAFPGWSGLGAQKRASFLLKTANLLEERMDEFALAESRDQGKPVWLARSVDIPRAVENLRHFANTTQHQLDTSKQHAGCISYTTREPIGVAGLISPWNLPLYLLTFKLAPALAAGNTVVAKPSELTSVTAFLLCQLFEEAGLPAGVLNMVMGSGAGVGAWMTAHPRVPVISFTGSTVTGAKIATTAAPLFKKVSLELGGKNPAIVYADCDVATTVATLKRSCFINQGQVCLCTSRVFVQRAVFEEVLRELVKVAKEMKVGDPSDAANFMGALNSDPHIVKVGGYVEAAVKGGATLECGDEILDLPHGLEGRSMLTGKADAAAIMREEIFGPVTFRTPLRRLFKWDPTCTQGYFMRPTILTGMADTAPCMREEIFGPVTCLTPFDTQEEVIRRANDTNFGLCAAVFTKDLNKAHTTAKALKVGTVWTNCWLLRDLDLPFGGAKQSGLGREGTKESYNFFTEQKTHTIKLSI